MNLERRNFNNTLETTILSLKELLKVKTVKDKRIPIRLGYFSLT